MVVFIVQMLAIQVKKVMSQARRKLKSALRSAKQNSDDDQYIRRASRELDDAENDIKRAIRSID